MNIGAVIPVEILSRTDLPIYVKLVYGRMIVLLEQYCSFVVTTDELASQCGLSRQSSGEVVAISGGVGADPVSSFSR